MIFEIAGTKSAYLYGKPTLKPLGGIFWKAHLPKPLQAPCTAQLQFDRVPESDKLLPSAICHDRLINKIAGQMQSAGTSLLKYKIVEYSLHWDSPLKNLHIEKE